ncbi:MAG TPA: right-handed parallel beta-helix repeat-containing protein [Phycisphaerales bacterium]|nr:right-handed parallel beta-helix repeat-containing protein [Phycisphaerales bacterium]
MDPAPRRKRNALYAAAAAASIALVALAGPLEPAPGPITSTGKALAELEPRITVNAANTPGDAVALYRITQPGSYILAGNIQGVGGKHGIAITCGGVTLDLNGFDMVGLAGIGGALDGVSVTAVDQTAVTIRNGSIRGWGGDGIDLGTANTNNSRVTGLRISANAGHGLTVGTGCAVTDCSVFGNNLTGITTAGGCKVSGCTSYSNIGHGIVAGTGSAVDGCTSYFNDAAGISVGNGCTVEGNTCRLNTNDGILAAAACVIRGNTCTTNGFGTGDGAGVHVTGTDCRVEANACMLSDRGIDVDTSGNLIIRNTCTGNTINWAIASGNAIGPIVVPATKTSSINGNAPAPSTLGTADPFANFNY